MNRIRKMSHKGDETVCEWEPTEVTDEELDKIESEYNQMVQDGRYIPANYGTKEVLNLDAPFDPSVDYLMIPRLVGGER